MTEFAFRAILSALASSCRYVLLSPCRHGVVEIERHHPVDCSIHSEEKASLEEMSLRICTLASNLYTDQLVSCETRTIETYLDYFRSYREDVPGDVSRLRLSLRRIGIKIQLSLLRLVSYLCLLILLLVFALDIALPFMHFQSLHLTL